MNTNKRIFGGVCVSACAGVWLGAACEQPTMYCTSAYGNYAVVLDLKESDGDCDDLPNGVDLTELESELAYIETYADTLDGLADWSQGNLVIRTSMMANYENIGLAHGEENQAETTVARAEFLSSKPQTGFCATEFIGDAELELDEIPPDEDPGTGETGEDDEYGDDDDDDDDTGDDDDDGGDDDDDDDDDDGDDDDDDGDDDDDDGDDDDDDGDPFPGQDAIDMRVAWDDLKFYVSPDAQGTQFSGELTIEFDDCTATYDAVGLYPAVACESDEDCENPNNGINPSLDTECDEASGWCTLAKSIPSYE